MTALTKRIQDLDIRRTQDKIKREIEQEAQQRPQEESVRQVKRVPFYNWLEEREDLQGNIVLS